jgi:hypothetical protein
LSDWRTRAQGGQIEVAAASGATVASGLESVESPSLGLRHALWVYAAPARLFSRVEDTGAYGLTLAVLLLIVTLIGYLQIQTGLVDRLVDQQTEEQLARVETEQANLVDRIELRTAMDDVRKNGEFMKIVRRLGAVVWTPLSMLVSFLLISSVLYAAVALSGRKPEYHTLMSICVYAGYIELVGIVLRFLMMLTYRTVHVDTSLAVLLPPGKAPYLAAVDPFRIWFWVLVTIGVIVTQQLGKRAAIVTCALMFLVSSGVRVGISYAAAMA